MREECGCCPSVVEAYIVCGLWRGGVMQGGRRFRAIPAPPGPLPSDEWWHLLKVKPAGEPSLGLARTGRQARLEPGLGLGMGMGLGLG